MFFSERKMDAKMNIKKILDDHSLWIRGAKEGKKADLTGADLTGADLTGADLRWADLRWADLRWADLARANLTGADLARANLTEANLTGADLRWADLARADLTGAILDGAIIVNALGNGKEIKTINVYKFIISWKTDVVAIGCMNSTLEEWRNMPIEKIPEEDRSDWIKYKDIVFMLVETFPAS
jgi:hypothetical protein